MAYIKTLWENDPSPQTPVSAANLNHLETQYDEAVATAKSYTDARETATRKYTDDELADALAGLSKASVGLGNVDNVSDANQPNLIRGSGGRSYRFVGGTIRYLTATSWGVVADTGHAPTGIASVQYYDNRIRVTYDFTATKVTTFVATPDETIAAVAGLRMGSSVGLTYTDIYIYTTAGGSTPINPNLLSNTSGNIWLWGVMEV